MHYSGESKILRMDAKKVIQIVLNLLNNAAKFTSQGKVELMVSYVKGRLEFIVKDTGIGIAEPQLKTIFEEFRQAEMSTARHYGGVGLGLAISQGLANLMGGKIEVESCVGEGSTFVFFFPCDESG